MNPDKRQELSPERQAKLEAARQAAKVSAVTLAGIAYLRDVSEARKRDYQRAYLDWRPEEPDMSFLGVFETLRTAGLGPNEPARDPTVVYGWVRGTRAAK